MKALPTWLLIAALGGALALPSAVLRAPLKAEPPTCWARVNLDGSRVYSSTGCMHAIPQRRERVRLNHSPLTAEQRLAYTRDDK